MVKLYTNILAMLCLGISPAFASNLQCTVALDALVARAGSAEVPAASGAAEPALASLGLMSVGDHTYSIWRIRNSDSRSRTATLYAKSPWAVARFTVPPHTYLFVRSEASAVSHVLLLGLRGPESRPPVRTLWHDSRSVADPLCAEPGTSLWVKRPAGFLRVSPIDGRVLVDIPLSQSRAGVFEIDPINGDLWTYDDAHLRAYDLRGRPLVDTRLAGREFSTNAPARLAVDGTHRVWLALGRNLFRLSAAGSSLGYTTLETEIMQLAFDRSTGTMWVAGAGTVSSWAAPSTEVGPGGPVVQRQLPALRFLAVDSASGNLWAIAADRLRSLDSAGNKLLDIRLTDLAAYERGAVDAHGGLWIAGARKLAHFDSAGVRDFSAVTPGPVPPGADRLAADLQAGTVWVAGTEHLWQYSRSGPALPLWGAIPADGLAPQPGLSLAASRRVEGVRMFNDFSPPEVSVEAPANLAVLSTHRPPLQIRASDHEGQLDPASVELRAGGVEQTVVCTASDSDRIQCKLQQDLPEGPVALSLSIADDAGNMSGPINWQVLIDTTSPASPVAALLRAQFVAPDSIEVVALAHAVEPGAVIIIRNLASGSITQGQAFADGSFILEIHGFPSDALQVHAADLAGNSSVPLSLAVTASTRELTLISPADGAIVTDRDLTVRGSLRGAEGAGVIVNGVPVNLSAAGDVHTFAARVPLVAGTNTLDIVAHLADGTQLESHRTVTLSNPAPFGIRLSDSHGVAPFTVSFALNEYTSVHAAEVAYDFDSDGKVDDLRVDIGEASSFTYLTAGDHKATVFITAEDGSRYRYEVPITALSRSDIDAQIRPVWHEFLAALSDQATERALRLLLPEFAIRAGPALADLKPALASIVAGLSEAAPGEMSPRLAEYVVTREISGSVHAFLIYFVLDANGIWRLASL